MQLVPTFHYGDPGSIPGQFVWDMWWTQWTKIFSEYFGFSCQLLFHQCPIMICHQGLLQEAHLRPRYKGTVSPYPKFQWRICLTIFRQCPYSPADRAIKSRRGFGCLKIGFVGSNLTCSIDICSLSAFVSSCVGRSLAMV
jgi:hypothetical protein